MIERKQLARQLVEASKLLEVLNDDRFRARAYANAARSLEAFEGDIAELAERGELTRIRGIGQGLAAELTAEPADGVLPLLAELRPRVPAGVRELFRIPGLGASKVRALWEAGIDSVEALIEAVDRGGVQALKGFGEKSAATFRKGAEFVLAAKTRMRRDVAEAALAELTWLLEAALPDARVTPAGSFRRGLETVDTLDLLVTGVPVAAFEAFALDSDGIVSPGGAELPVGAEASGGAETSRRTLSPGGAEASGQAEASRAEPLGLAVYSVRRDGKTIRFVLAPVEAEGAALTVLTGSDAYVAWLQERAAERDLRLVPTGLFRGDTRVETPSEEAVFATIGVPRPAPELRERPGAMPVEDLIELSDLHGLVHNHSTWSDAEHSIRQMVAAARRAGYQYLALADHSRSSFYANGLSADRVRRQAEEVHAIRAELAAEGSDFALLHGIEVDILPDGSLDYGDDVLALLDYAVVSVHQQFTLKREEQTQRIVTAVQSPYADILGHATGRLLLRRPGYDVDLDAVIDACARSNTVIEINANPARLDMDWRWVRVAKERGCRFSIDPDAHHVDGYGDLRFGVSVARKAALTRADVVNTAPTAEAFLARLKRASAEP